VKLSRHRLFGLLAAAPLAPLVAAASAPPVGTLAVDTNVNTWGTLLNTRHGLYSAHVSDAQHAYNYFKSREVEIVAMAPRGWDRRA
jgi:hypothetical protein